MEKRENIIKDEVSLLKKTYPNDYLDWINMVKQKIKIKFVPCKIHIDDTVNDIREKIFIFMSDVENKSYILPQNPICTKRVS